MSQQQAECYIHQRGSRYRVILPRHLLQQRYVGSYPDLESARVARDSILRDLKGELPQANLSPDVTTSHSNPQLNAVSPVTSPSTVPDILPDAPVWTSQGVYADEVPDEEEVYKRVVGEYERTVDTEQRRHTQQLLFPHGPICLVFAGDQHFGSSGTDYRRVFAEAELVRDTPGMYLCTMGDMVDQFVIGRLRQARDNTHIAIQD